jgi:hypothetical protein
MKSTLSSETLRIDSLKFIPNNYSIQYQKRTLGSCGSKWAHSLINWSEFIADPMTLGHYKDSKENIATDFDNYIKNGCQRS